MKKTILAALFCFTLGIGNAMAQEEMTEFPQQNQMRRNGSHMRQLGNGSMRQGAEMLLADTTILNQISLTPAEREGIDRLNANFQEAVHALMNKRENGKRISREEAQARMEQIKELKAQGRQELRTLLGDDTYIYYLEQLLDRRPQFGGNRGMMPVGNGMHGRPRANGFDPSFDPNNDF